MCSCDGAGQRRSCPCPGTPPTPSRPSASPSLGGTGAASPKPPALIIQTLFALTVSPPRGHRGSPALPRPGCQRSLGDASAVPAQQHFLRRGCPGWANPTPALSTPQGPATSTLYGSWGTGGAQPLCASPGTRPARSISLALPHPAPRSWWQNQGLLGGVWDEPHTRELQPCGEQSQWGRSREFLPWFVLELHRAAGLTCNQLPPRAASP